MRLAGMMCVRRGCFTIYSFSSNLVWYYGDDDFWSNRVLEPYFSSIIRYFGYRLSYRRLKRALLHAGTVNFRWSLPYLSRLSPTEETKKAPMNTRYQSCHSRSKGERGPEWEKEWNGQGTSQWNGYGLNDASACAQMCTTPCSLREGILQLLSNLQIEEDEIS